MNLRQFKYVKALAEKGSFSKAAEELHVSQPSLSQYIKRVESELGIVLFDRTGGNVRLTDAGRIYLDAGREILDTEYDMQQKFSDLRRNEFGTLTVGVAPTRCQYLMPEIAKRFRKEFPGMHLIVKERFLGQLMEDAERGEFDLCIATLPVDDDKFGYEVMMREEVVLCVPNAMPICETLRTSARARDGRLFPAVDIRTIADMSYVALSETQPTQIQLEKLCRSCRFSVKTAIECMSIETQYSMVCAGLGLALLPSSIPKYAPNTSLSYFSLIQEISYREMAVIYRKGQYLSSAALVLKNIMLSL